MAGRKRRRFESLSDAQQVSLVTVRQEWLDIGLSTAPADRPAAEEYVAQAYRIAGLDPPEVIIWLESPLAGAIGAGLLTRSRAEVGDQVQDQVRAQVRAQVCRAAYRQHDAPWLAFYAAFKKFGVSGSERLDGIAGVARTAGWWWPFGRTVILTDRPETLSRDEDGRLHSVEGMALRYRDGWGIYAVHGVRLTPAQHAIISQPQLADVRDVLKEQNAEVRRVMIERVGMARVLREGRAEEIARDEYGTLHRLDLSDDEPLVMVTVADSTPIHGLGWGATVEDILATVGPDAPRKQYTLRVPPETRTPIAGLAWCARVSESAYAEMAVQT